MPLWLFMVSLRFLLLRRRLICIKWSALKRYLFLWCISVCLEAKSFVIYEIRKVSFPLINFPTAPNFSKSPRAKFSQIVDESETENFRFLLRYFNWGISGRVDKWLMSLRGINENLFQSCCILNLMLDSDCEWIQLFPSLDWISMKIFMKKLTLWA